MVKLSSIGVALGALIAVISATEMISGVESSEKGKIAVDLIIFFVAILLIAESTAHRYRGMPTNVLPKKGNYVIESKPAPCRQKEGQTAEAFVILLAAKDPTSGILHGWQKNEDVYKKDIRAYLLTKDNIDPGDNVTFENLIAALQDEATLGEDELHFYPNKTVYLVMR